MRLRILFLHQRLFRISPLWSMTLTCLKSSNPRLSSFRPSNLRSSNLSPCLARSSHIYIYIYSLFATGLVSVTRICTDLGTTLPLQSPLISSAPASLQGIPALIGADPGGPWMASPRCELLRNSIPNKLVHHVSTHRLYSHDLQMCTIAPPNERCAVQCHARPTCGSIKSTITIYFSSSHTS